MLFHFTQYVDLSRLHAHLIDNAMLLPFFFGSFFGHFVARTLFPTKFTTLLEIAHPVMHKLFNISFILVVRPTDKVVGLPKRGRGNKKGNHSVDVINLLKSMDFQGGFSKY